MIIGSRISRLEKVKVEQSQGTGNPSLSFQWLDQNDIEWIIDNPTQSEIYVSILRNGYVFGSAFAEVYIGNGYVDLWTDKSQSTSDSNPYRMAVLSSNNFKNIVFVFKVPPKTVLHVPEGGFSQQNPPADYSLINVTPSSLKSYLVAYDPVLPMAYILQTGNVVLSMPDPYPLTVYEFTSNVNLPNPFPRLFFQYSTLQKLLLPVS
ncbi:hypothetical protein SFV1gp28 [Sulfolobus filamentous virus 1]|uniref:Uncharacterized protein n=1 Tax=Sulfolobus filamentous virus 1 TaxID=2304198 RepID=A0A346LU67_SUFV1|nr:hypothetical protein HOT91_gp28 [Sulfolobus filamentous virus 1]AXQ00110.1 hypothetical protein SFV1gp28 [Sulfolobus filamentous virus 1]